jgi:hypothetical protein
MTIPKKENSKTEQKAKEKATKKKIREENNANIVEANRQLEVIAQKFIENPQPFFDERVKEVAKVIERYGNLQTEDLENGIITKKDYSIQLSKHLIKPFIPNTGSVIQKHTPHSIKMVSDFYWNEIVLKVNETTQFVPSLYHICKLLNISYDTLRRYANDGDEQMRETCAMIKDEFIDYYQQKGLTKELNDIMAMFVLKTTFQQRENDQPQVAVVNVNASPQEKIDKYARQYGFEVWSEND